MYLKWLQKYNLLAFEEIDSTNDEAKRLIESGAFDRLVVWSKNQKSGRGRYGRNWESQEGNLFLSILTPINCTLQKATQLSFVMAVAVADIIESLAIKHKKDLKIQLKWPNDVLVNGKKIAGILMEALPEAVDDWVILGLGMNVESKPSLDTATSLKELGIKCSVGEALGMVMNQFDYYHDMWVIYDFPNIRKVWLKKAYKLGEVVTVSDIKTRISGVFGGLDKEGAIKIKLASGEEFCYTTGEIFFG